MPTALPRSAAFLRLAADFHNCHRASANVAMHLITTPLGMLAALLLLAQLSPWAPPLLTLAYLLSLWGAISARLLYPTFCHR